MTSSRRESVPVATIAGRFKEIHAQELVVPSYLVGVGYSFRIDGLFVDKSR
jgi:hypothetical protein